jgi:glycosyltransferase involved in cell wall biosynthesis
MKILVVIPLVYGGGAEQVGAILSREWSVRHQVRVLAFHVGAEQLDFGVPVENLGLPARKGLWARFKTAVLRVQAIAKCARAFHPDVVMAFMDEAGMICTLAGLRQGWLDRLVVSVHHNPQWLSRSRRFLLALFYRLPGKVVAVSQGVQDELRRSLMLAVDKILHIPNPLVIRVDTDRGQAHTKLSALPAEFILFAGRLDWQVKGLDVLLYAYAGLPGASRPALVMLGDGPDRTRLEAEIQRLGLGADIFLLGWQSDPYPFYARAKLFVMSSRFEGWSNVLMEAIGQGCLVAATHCPYGPPEILGPAFQHLLVPVGDFKALTRLMNHLLGLAPPERQALQAALKARAQIFAAPAVAERWIELALSMSGRRK